MTSWQSIETAPKGETVDLWVQEAPDLGYRIADCYWYQRGSRWAYGHCHHIGAPATHWMPLPEPPND